MKKLIALLGGMALVGLVACEEGKPAAEKKVEKTAMKVENKAASQAAAKKDDGANKAGAGQDAQKDMDPAAKEAAEAEKYAATILEVDYDAEALAQINDANADKELADLEKVIEEK